ncbi:hypothetical protein EJ05DRAFT_488074 [Pseudovirgaria hyperparasitica]|uniref:Uncharacterized protein n=1 Tax=Pseudovirgaria hyperparasitica TaxID=470096 RepID=A0A6A6W2S7_9PEZI|nr:uncharacterized protein EJ05DRAFT_488074 [Pseudovirgaria hyperparasitica]KAF2756296.1 hypothetical protein EJ05DRAFT_488074 [Pseudovirgaria hyperparasitica]
MGIFKSRPASEDQHHRLLQTMDDGDVSMTYVQKQRSRCAIFTSWFGSFVFGVLASSLVFGLLIKQGHLIVRHSYSFRDTDPLPHVPQETILFEADPVYSERANDDTDYAWNMLLPVSRHDILASGWLLRIEQQGRGFVYVSDAESRGLPPGQQTKHGPIYSVSMYHQLHCLARLRKMQWIMIDGVAILCAGDMTLEWPKQDGPSSGIAVDGWGIPHTCKSKVAIDDYMDRYHYNESMYFDAAGR